MKYINIPHCALLYKKIIWYSARRTAGERRDIIYRFIAGTQAPVSRFVFVREWGVTVHSKRSAPILALAFPVRFNRSPFLRCLNTLDLKNQILEVKQRK